MIPLSPTLANSLWVAGCRPAWGRFQQAAARVAETQAGLLAGYLSANGDTAFGRRHGFAALRSPAAYQQAVPLTTYDDYAADIEAIGAGQAGVLTAGPVRLLEPSSGSTAASKLIPYTAELQAEFQRGLAPWIYDLYTRDPALKDGPAYWSITPLTDGPRRTPGGLPIGFEADSAYLGRLGQALLARVLAVPDAVKHLPDVDSLRYVTLLCLLRQPELRLISVWHPTFLSLLLAPLAEWWDRLLFDLAYAQINPPSAVDPALVDKLKRGLRPDPKRARALSRQAPDDYRAHWPALRLLSCWADGAAAGYAAELSQASFPGVRLQGKGLLATEAFVSLPLAEANGSVLAVTSHFFEFLPLDREQAPVLGSPSLAHQLDVGQTYAVVVTTGGGLYRYQLHDLVQVIGHYRQAPCLRFVGKTDLVSDWFGEKLSESFVAAASEQLCQRHHLAPRFTLLAPETTAAGVGYVLYLELPAGQEVNGSAPAIAADLEARLCANFHYAYCRRLGQLAAARVAYTAPGAAERYLRACQARGQRLGNIKPARLAKDDGWAAALAAERVPA